MTTEQSSFAHTRPAAAVFGRRNRPDGLDAFMDSFMAHLHNWIFLSTERSTRPDDGELQSPLETINHRLDSSAFRCSSSVCSSERCPVQPVWPIPAK
jgi:hypothetical protein